MQGEQMTWVIPRVSILCPDSGKKFNKGNPKPDDVKQYTWALTIRM